MFTYFVYKNVLCSVYIVRVYVVYKNEKYKNRISSWYVMAIVFFPINERGSSWLSAFVDASGSVASYYRDRIYDKEQERERQDGKSKLEKIYGAVWYQVAISRHLSRERREMGASCRGLLQKNLHLPKLQFIEVLGPMQIYRGVAQLKFVLDTEIIGATRRQFFDRLPKNETFNRQTYCASLWNNIARYTYPVDL